MNSNRLPGEHQHFVPQFLLRGFCSESNDQIHVFDKSEAREFKTNIRNVASQKGFYDLEVGEGLVASLDPSLQELEDITASLISQIVSSESITSLSLPNMAYIAKFVASQMLRTAQHRERILSMSRAAENHVRSMGTDPEKVQNLGILDENGAKQISLQMMTNLKEYIEAILQKRWMLQRVPADTVHYISDHPVVMHNDIKRPPRGNIGLAVPGIEIYLPLTATLVLAMYCPSHDAGLRYAYSRRQIEIALGQRDSMPNDFENTRAMLNAFTSGKPLDLVEDNVLRLNSLQVYYSSRFLFANRGGFDLARSMIKERPELRKGPPIEVA